MRTEQLPTSNHEANAFDPERDPFDAERAGFVCVFQLQTGDYPTSKTFTNYNALTYKFPNCSLEVYVNKDDGRVRILKEAPEGQSPIVFHDDLERPNPSHNAVLAILRANRWEG